MDATDEIARGCVDRAMSELGIDEVPGRTYSFASLSARLAIRESLGNAQPMVARMVELAGRSGTSAGFDIAVATIDGWAKGFIGGDTRGKLEALARDLRRLKDELIGDAIATAARSDETLQAAQSEGPQSGHESGIALT